MAKSTASKVVEVQPDEEVDFQIDDEDYSEVDEADLGPVVEVDDDAMTTTENFMGAQAVILNEVQDLGVTVVQGERTYRCRVIEDIGPVYYGDDLVEMKKGHLYEVPEHIYAWLRSKNKLWDQQ